MSSSTVQARLHRRDRETLDTLAKRLGWTPSQVVREGLRLLAICHPVNGRRQVIGSGKFKSGISDLGSNPRHLKGFGK